MRASHDTDVSDLSALCKEIVEYANRGDPVKDVIESSNFYTDELIVILAKEFLADAGSVPRRIDIEDLSKITLRNGDSVTFSIPWDVT